MQVIRTAARRVPGLGRAVSKFRYSGLRSGDYWETRYRGGGNSGLGSLGELASYKAAFLNRFVREHSIERVVEFGCGDGEQLRLAEYPEYVGLDVSSAAIERCIQLFAGDRRKAFFLYGPNQFADALGVFAAPLAISLDVVYHLVEDEVFDRYMRHLFGSAQRHVVVYSSNDPERPSRVPWIRHRRYTDWIDRNAHGWRLDRWEPNPHASVDVFAEFRVFSRT